ncbi:MAG: HEAT repeat domain-containing protein [Planctomycetes bacterium]|nr:HEAT repeat domain-containing protein [Planctomycetota bacterium]
MRGGLAFCLGATLAICAGCTGRTWFFRQKPDPVLANLNIETPQQRVAKLQELSATARDGGDAEQERVSAELAQTIQTEEDPLIRAEILRVLAVCRTATAAAVLTAAMRDADHDVRVVCCEAWAEQGGEQATRALTDLLANDKNVDVRLAAARALGRLGDPAATTALATALEDGDPAMQYRAVQSLRTVSGRDFGNDANAWREFASGGNPQPAPSSFVQRWLDWF